MAIIDSKLAKDHGATDSPTADKDDKAEEWLNQNSAGGGPFILKGWQRNTGITLERNPNYWGTAPKVAKVEIRDVNSPATQKLQVENGDVDIALNLTPDLVATMKSNKNVKIITGQSLDNMYLGMTCDPQIHPELAKKEVRQAIRHAIDYDGIIALTNKQAVVGPAVYSIGILGLNPGRRRPAESEVPTSRRPRSSWPRPACRTDSSSRSATAPARRRSESPTIRSRRRSRPT